MQRWCSIPQMDLKRNLSQISRCRSTSEIRVSQALVTLRRFISLPAVHTRAFPKRIPNYLEVDRARRNRRIHYPARVVVKSRTPPLPQDLFVRADAPAPTGSCGRRRLSMPFQTHFADSWEPQFFVIFFQWARVASITRTKSL